MAICEKGIPYEHQRICLVLLIAIRPQEALMFRELLNQISELLACEELLAKMMKCQSQEAFIQTLYTALDS